MLIQKEFGAENIVGHTVKIKSGWNFAEQSAIGKEVKKNLNNELLW